MNPKISALGRVKTAATYNRFSTHLRYRSTPRRFSFEEQVRAREKAAAEFSRMSVADRSARQPQKRGDAARRIEFDALIALGL